MVRRAGKLRPSQVATQFGPGCLIDLPELSMILAGLDDWNTGTAKTIGEPRLQRALGVRHFKLPPFLTREGTGGLPARIFPEFLVCPRCNRLARHHKFHFPERGAKHLCKSGECRGGGNASAYPARFMVACANGHLDDFPWHSWVHADKPDCDAELRLEDSGQTGSITDLWVRCPRHDNKMSLGLAFGKQGQSRLPGCNARRPWLDDHDPKGCDERVRVLLRGASNAYFAVTASALSIPPWSDPLQIEVGKYEEMFAAVDSEEKLAVVLEVLNLPDLKIFGSDQIWEGLLKLRGHLNDLEPADLRTDEYAAFLGSSGPIDHRAEFKVSPETVPTNLALHIGDVVRATRLREVRALRGFTRIDSIPDIGEMIEVSALDAGLAPIARQRPDWLPGVEARGEGIFITLAKGTLSGWEQKKRVIAYTERLSRAQHSWFEARDTPPGRTRDARFVLLHSIAHLTIRQMELEAGYAGSSLRERIYCDADMAGFLVYTATPDSSGTLGGLVELARPEALGPMFVRAFEAARLCANDPFCASREPDHENLVLNGAACHACLLLPETSCEAGNHYLDRALVVHAVGREAVEFVGE